MRRFTKRTKRATARRKNPTVQTGRKSGTVRSGFRRYPGPIQVPPSQAIMIQLRNYFQAKSDGSGIIAGVIPADPSATLSSYFNSVVLSPEWSDWSALFGSVKIVQIELKMLPATVDEVKGDTNAGMVFASNMQSTAVPSNYQSLADNADSQVWNCMTDSTSIGRYHAVRYPKSVLWASAGTPSPSSTQLSGCPGGIGMYGSGMPVSTNVFTIHWTGTYLLMNRT